MYAGQLEPGSSAPGVVQPKYEHNPERFSFQKWNALRGQAQKTAG